MREPEDDLTAAERELEVALGSLSPAAATVDPVAAAFDAGYATGRSHVQRWRAAAALLLVIGACAWLRAALPGTGDHGVRPAPPIALATRQTPPELPPLPLPPQSVLMLRQVVSDGGVAALPPSELPAVRATRASTDSL
jgi:hypothetical protein